MDCIRRIVILFILLLCASPLWGATYYVNQSGTSACGQSTSYSIAQFNAGGSPFNNLDNDTVYFCGSITTAMVIPDGGTSGNVVTLRGDYPSSAGTIDISGGNSSVINTNDKDYVTIRNLTIKNGGWSADNGRTTDNGGIFVTSGSTNITIDGCTIDNDLDGTDDFGNGISVLGSNVTITNNTITDIADTECFCTGDGTTPCVDNGDCVANGTCSCHESDGIYISSAGSNFTITGNTISETIDRNAISVIKGSIFDISDNTINISDGDTLHSGIDLEPNVNGETVADVTIDNTNITMPSSTSYSGIILAKGDPGAVFSNIVIQNLTIDLTTAAGDGGTTANKAIQFDSCGDADTVVDNVVFNNAKWGIISDATTYVTVQNSTFNSIYKGVYIYEEDSDNWTIDSNTFTIVQGTQSVGVDVRLGGDSISITDNDMTGGAYGIRIGNNNAADVSSDITITGNTVDASGDDGTSATTHPIQIVVESGSDNYIISDNTVTNPAEDVDCMELRWDGNPTTVTITDNVITNNNTDNGDYGIVVDMYDTGTATITGNLVEDVPTGGIYVLGGSGHTIYGNMIKDSGFVNNPDCTALDEPWGCCTGLDTGSCNQQAGIQITGMDWGGYEYDPSNHVVSYNILKDCGRGIGLDVSGNQTINGVRIYNNVVYGTYSDFTIVGASIYLYTANGAIGTISNIEVKNNILYENVDNYHIAVDSGSVSGFVASNNLYYGTATNGWYYNGGVKADLATWVTASSETGAKEADPRFKFPPDSDFRLKKNSPAIDAGANLGATYDDGLSRNTTSPTFETLDQDDYGSGWEIGAYVYSGKLTGTIIDGRGSPRKGKRFYVTAYGVTGSGATKHGDGLAYVRQGLSNLDGTWNLYTLDVGDEYLVVYSLFDTHKRDKYPAGSDFMTVVKE